MDETVGNFINRLWESDSIGHTADKTAAVTAVGSSHDPCDSDSLNIDHGTSFEDEEESCGTRVVHGGSADSEIASFGDKLGEPVTAPGTPPRGIPGCLYMKSYRRHLHEDTNEHPFESAATPPDFAVAMPEQAEQYTQQENGQHNSRSLVDILLAPFCGCCRHDQSDQNIEMANRVGFEDPPPGSRVV